MIHKLLYGVVASLWMAGTISAREEVRRSYEAYKKNGTPLPVYDTGDKRHWMMVDILRAKKDKHPFYQPWKTPTYQMVALLIIALIILASVWIYHGHQAHLDAQLDALMVR